MTDTQRPATTPAKPSTEHAPDQAKGQRSRVRNILIAIALVIVLFWFGLYKWNWHGPVTRLVSRVVPYPAAVVNGYSIRWSDFEDNVVVLQHFYDQQKPKAVPGSVFPTDADIKQRVIDRLERDQIAAVYAQSIGVSVSDAEVNAAYERMAVPAPGSPTSPTSKAAAELQAAQTLNDTYGISSSTYKALVLRPLLLRQKLDAKISQDDALNVDKFNKAKEAADALRTGTSFKEVFLQYNEDQGLETTSGELGPIGPGLMPAEVDKALALAKTGDVLGPIKSALGYHVLKVGDIKDDGKVRKTTLEELIVKPIGIDAWLDAQAKKANITSFVN